MKLKDKKVALFAAELYEDLELWYPYYRMKEEGAGVVVVGPDEKDYRGKHGISVKADKAINGVRPDEFDGLIIPGGYAPDHMRRLPKMVDFIKQMNDDGKVIAAICHGGWMLASAGIIRDKQITGFYSIKDDIENAGGKWANREVVRDGNLITSRNPTDLPAFCRTIIESLA